MNPSDPISRARQIRDRLPAGGLFHEKSWRVSPDPFPITETFFKRLEKLGHQLLLFQRACAQLYRTSADGRQPAWIAELLDRGKPPELVALQRNRRFGNEISRVIRPDIIPTAEGFVIAELDSVPGGIGLTAWLNRSYAPWNPRLVGGANGMTDGFASILPEGDIVVSEEASTYRPEMEWLAATLNATSDSPARWRVLDTAEREDWAPRIYRFFELFDLENVPCAGQLTQLALEGKVHISPPLKPALEEKLWFALFWLRPLESFWIRALGDSTFRALREVVPQTWLLDPQPLPPHAVIPGLGVHSWGEVEKFSQKQRDLILKISGFSESAWGSRGVVLGSDAASPAWADALRRALEAWPQNPHILQKYHHARPFEHPWLDPATETIQSLRCRARLCPYYFVTPEGARLGGMLATLCPDDKKLLHGMSDAILTPSAVAEEGC